MKILKIGDLRATRPSVKLSPAYSLISLHNVTKQLEGWLLTAEATNGLSLWKELDELCHPHHTSWPDFANLKKSPLTPEPNISFCCACAACPASRLGCLPTAPTSAGPLPTMSTSPRGWRPIRFLTGIPALLTATERHARSFDGTSRPVVRLSGRSLRVGCWTVG